MEKFKARNMVLLLYPDNENHAKAIEYIKNNYDYVYIMHDKDTDKNGDLKKIHIHCIINFNNPKWNSAIAKELNIEERFIEQIKEEQKIYMYLIHQNQNGKYKYEIKDCIGTKKCLIKLNNYYNDEELGEDEALQKILKCLEEKETKNIKYAIEILIENGLTKYIKKYQLIILKIIEQNRYKR